MLMSVASHKGQVLVSNIGRDKVGLQMVYRWFTDACYLFISGDLVIAWHALRPLACAA